ncbi:MAG TPA: pyridoxamine 5-phosphate oxidase [Spirochaeta sp.]|nr:pyridoxamine 5-phosphate oxidase [Spirochaeta sp.]
MSAVTEAIKQAWENREGPIVLTTVGNDGNPNNIYATEVNMQGNDKIVIANKFIDRTMKNRLPDSKGSVVFVTEDKKSYLVKGEVHYEYAGKNFKFMKTWSKDRHPGHGAAVINIDSVFEDGRQVV